MKVHSKSLPMATAHELGRMAEDLAVDYYKKNGYSIVVRNYRYQKAEVDLIVRKANYLVAVEVKARSTAYFGAPEKFITPKKVKLLVMAMDAYVNQNNLDVEIRFDVMSYLLCDGKWVCNPIQNAFYPF